MLGGSTVKLGMSHQFPLKDGLGSTFDLCPALTDVYPSVFFSYLFTLVTSLLLVTPPLLG